MIGATTSWYTISFVSSFALTLNVSTSLVDNVSDSVPTETPFTFISLIVAPEILLVIVTGTGLI
mgnify:CR=1 FL=1